MTQSTGRHSREITAHDDVAVAWSDREDGNRRAGRTGQHRAA